MKKDINLKDKGLHKRKSKNPIFSIFMVLVFLLAFGVLFFLNTMVEREMNQTKKEKTKIESSLKSDDLKEAYNFGMDLINLENQIKNEDLLLQTSNIIKISEQTLPQIVFNSLSIKTENGLSKLNIDLDAPDLETFIKQIKIYKKMKNVEGVFFGDIKNKESEDGIKMKTINTSVSFTLGEFIEDDVNSEIKNKDKKDF